VLLNSDARLAPGALDSLLEALETHSDVGLAGPEIVDEGGALQRSAFRDPSPLGELLESVDVGWLRRILARHDPLLEAPSGPARVDWLSFACVAVRRETFEAVGTLDESYFMYFEDGDFCRRAREGGWGVLHWPAARAVHNEGSSGSVPSTRRRGARPPLYFYASRARYFAKFYGRSGLWAANLFRMLGHPVSWLRRALGRGRPTVADSQWRDLWHNAGDPLAARARPASQNERGS
jgi:GT2 family glycosyltransferase